VRQRYSMGWFQRYDLVLHDSNREIKTHTNNLKEYIYGTTIQHNYNVGWGVITLSSYDIFQQTRQLPGFQTSMLGQILTNETNPLFSWQYNEVRSLTLYIPFPVQGHIFNANIFI